MSDDRTRQGGDELPEVDPVADNEVTDGLEDQFGRDFSGDGAEDADLEGDANKDKSKKASKKTSKTAARKATKASAKKTVATRKCSEAEHGEYDLYRTKNPAQFVCQSMVELERIM